MLFFRTLKWAPHFNVQKSVLLHSVGFLHLMQQKNDPLGARCAQRVELLMDGCVFLQPLQRFFHKLGQGRTAQHTLL
jgi:hypothetical protein